MRVNIPDERKFEIYHAVETQLVSRREAARRFGISPTRVQQIVSDVQTFVVRHGGDALLTMPAAFLELGALNVCHEKLQFFYSQIIRQWRSEMNQGANSVRLLQAAARLSIEQAKLAGRIAKVRLAMLEAGLLEEGANEFVYAEDEAEQDETVAGRDPAEDQVAELPAIAPPAGGCTADDDRSYPEDLQAMLDVLAKSDDNTACDALVAALLKRGEANAREQTPAQPR